VARNPMRPESRAHVAPRWLGVRLVLAVSVGAFSIGAFLWSCSGGSNDTPPAPGETVGGNPSATAPPDCSVANAGCPCTQPGEIVKCGHVVYKSESYVSCSLGLRTCQADGTWTDCQGNQVVTLNRWQADGLRLLSQPQPAAVSANNVCDPSLYEIPSILGTQDAAINDGAVTVLDSGAVTLTFGACNGSVGCGDAAAPPLTVTPADASLQITQIPLDGALPSPNSLQFTANLSGCAGDGAVNAIWTSDQPGVATMAEGGLLSLVSAYAGPIHVTAYAGSQAGTATANVTINVIDTSGVTDGGGLTKAFSTTCGVDAGGGG